MATYLQGVTDYIPEIQPFQPNLNFYKGVLDTKQAQYQAGYDRISKIYGQLLNSPLTRDINIERREDFFNNINNEIQKLSGVDLSLRQNQDAAYQVFQPLINDQNILKDMAWTKVLRDEYQKSESFKNCTNEEKCGGKWWEGGVQALNFMRMDFANASDEEAMQMGNAYYTPYVNVTDKAFKMAKDMGFNVQSVTWSPDGKYIVTTKGGQALVAPLNDYFNSVLGQDPNIQGYYKTLAYLDRKNFSYTNVEKYGSESAAEKFYLNNKIEYINNLVNQQKEQTENLLNGIKTDKAIIEQNKDLDPELNKNVYDYYLSLSQDEEVLNQSLDNTNNTGGLVDRSTLLDADLNTLRDRVDQGMSSILLQQDLFNAAINYAKLNNEVDIKADPYEEARFKHGLQMKEMEERYLYEKDLYQFKTAIDMISGKGGKDGVGKKLDGNPFLHNSAWEKVEGKPGATATKNVFESATESLDKSAIGYNQTRAAYLFSLYLKTKGLLDNTVTSADIKTKVRGALTEVIGKDNVDQFIKNGYINENFDITNLGSFNAAITAFANQDNKLMDRAKTQVKSLNNVGIISNEEMSNYTEIARIYDIQKSLYDKNLETYKNNIKIVKDYVLGTKTAKYSTGDLEKQLANIQLILKDNPNAVYPEIRGKNLPNVRYDEKAAELQRQITENKAEQTYQNDLFNAFVDEKTGKFRTEDEFVNLMHNTYEDKKGGLEKFRNRHSAWNLLGLLGPGPGTVVGMVGLVREAQNFFTDKQDKGVLRDKYKELVNNVKKEFNSGRLKAFPQGTHTSADGLATTVDYADFSSEGVASTISVINNFKNVKDLDNVGAFLGTDQSKISVLGKKSKEERALIIINKLENDYYNDYDYKDNNRPIFKFTGYDVAFNDANQVAYTIELSENYMRANRGTNTNPGEFYTFFDTNGNLVPNGNTVTISMPRDKADNYFNEMTKETVYDEMFKSGIPINISGSKINDKPEYNFVIKKNQFGQGQITGSISTYNPDGTWREDPLELYAQETTFDLTSGISLDAIMKRYKEIGTAVANMNLQTYYQRRKY
jgi:hypothetical protein